MDGYHRDSLRELRRMSEEQQRVPRRERGSVFITLLIILLFLAAGGFYLKTSQPEWLEQYFSSETIKGWKEDIVSVFSSQDGDVQKTVDGALAEQNEEA